MSIYDYRISVCTKRLKFTGEERSILAEGKPLHCETFVLIINSQNYGTYILLSISRSIKYISYLEIILFPGRNKMGFFACEQNNSISYIRYLSPYVCQMERERRGRYG